MLCFTPVPSPDTPAWWSSVGRRSLECCAPPPARLVYSLAVSSDAGSALEGEVFVRRTPWAAWTKAARTYRLPCLLRPLSRLPALSFCPGQTSAKATEVLGIQEAREVVSHFGQQQLDGLSADSRDVRTALDLLLKRSQAPFQFLFE